MKRIYVAFRKDDTSESYGRLTERLRDYFGSEAILRTDTTYATGAAQSASATAEDYRAYVAREMKQCAILLALIGPHWLTSPAAGGWDIAVPDDPIRIEIEEALRTGVPVIPVLTQGGVMPQLGQLPPSVALMLEQDAHNRRRKSDTLLALVSRSGLIVRRDPDFGGDTQRLCEVIENLARLEASSPQRAVRSIGRILREVTLLGAAALTLHAILLAYFAYHLTLTTKPALVVPAHWLSQVVSASVIDIGVYFLIGYVASRRTGDTGAGVIASAVAYVLSLLIGLGIFADIAWSNWQPLTAYLTQSTPALLVGAPNWLLAPTLLLMRPFLLTCAVLIVGAPVGLLVSLCFGWLGGSVASDVALLLTGRAAQRQQRALLAGETATRASLPLRQRGSALFRRRTTSAPAVRRGSVAGKIFISYRRDDSAVMCGAIYDRLTQAFGLDTVFKDVDMIPVGVNFERYIARTLEQCVAQVVVIGPQWVTIRTAGGERRLDDPKDFVRLEVESALRDGLMVVPALVQGATLPSADELPESLRPLADLDAVQIHYAPEFDGDMRILSQRMATALWPARAREAFTKRLRAVRLRGGGVRQAALAWQALFAVFGVAVGLAAIHIFLQTVGQRSSLALEFLPPALITATALTAICAAHLGFISARVRQATWLAVRSAIVGAAAVTLTCMISGWLTLGHNTQAAASNPNYRALAVGAPLIALVALVGPQLFVALIAAAIAASVRSARQDGHILSRAPQRLLIVARAEDATASAHITAGLIGYFGRRVASSRVSALARRASVAAATQARRALAPWQSQLARILPVRPPATPATATARSVRGAAAMLVLVGRGWDAAVAPQASQVDQVDPVGFAQTDDPTRVAIETALGLETPIVPIFLTGATMPAPDQLPASMREFAMLNGAWIRDAPDYDGDMRRLTRVVERLTRLRQRRRFTQTSLPLIAGVLWSALALTCIDALGAIVAMYAIDHFGSHAQSLDVGAAAAVAVLDAAVYALTGALVTRSTGSRLSGVLTSLGGAAVGALVGAFALRAASTQLLAATIAVDYSIAKSLSLYHQFAAYALTFAAARILLVLPVAVVLAILTAIYGRIAYQGNERRAQERRLYEMTRISAQESQREARAAEVTARGVRSRVTPPAQPASAAPLASAAESRSTPQTEPAAQPALAASLPASDEAAAQPLALDALVQVEVARRERLRAEMLQARSRMQTRRTTRLAAVLAGALVVALVAILASGQVYRRQVAGTSALATTIVAQGTANAAVTATAQFYIPYKTVLLGPECASASASSNLAVDGNWQSTDATEDVTCDPAATATTLGASPEFPVAGQLRYTLFNSLAPTYSVEVDVAHLSSGACAGLITDGDLNTDAVYLYSLCADNTWQIVSYSDDSGQQLIAHGNVTAIGSGSLSVAVSGAQRIFSVNGAQVADIGYKNPARGSTMPIFVGVCLGIKVGGLADVGEVTADFSDFGYIPQP